VMVTEPESGRAAGLYYTDSRYSDLEALLAGGATLPGEPPPRLGARAVSLTWLVHDVQPWRSQRLYPDAAGGPAVATPGTQVTGDEGQLTWTRLADRGAVAAVLESTFRGSSRPAAAVAEPPTAKTVVTERKVVRTETDWFSLAGWRWLLPGLVVGAGLALLLGRRRAEAAEPLLLTDRGDGPGATPDRATASPAGRPG
jgi:hypothetical protein